MGEPAFQLPEEDQPDIRPNLRALEGGGESTPRPKGHLHSAGEDNEREGLFNAVGDTDAPGGDESDGKGDKKGLFNPAETAMPWGQLSKAKRALWGSKRRKATTAGVVSGVAGIIITMVAIFSMLVPLKIEGMVSNLESRFGAASSGAIDKTASNMFRQYLLKYIMPNIGHGTCFDTRDASCVSKVRGDGLFAQAYKGWQNDRIEKKLADRGLSFGKSGGRYYANTGGKKIDLGGNKAAFEDFLKDPNTTTGKKHEVEVAISKYLKQATLSERIYYRFRLAPFLNKKYGIRHCINACKPINKFTDKIATKKMAAKAYLVNRVLSPLSQEYGFILQCALMGQGECKVDPLQQAGDGDTTQSTAADKKLRARLDSAAARFGSEKLADLVEKSNQLSKDGLAKFFTREATKKIVSMAGGDAAGAAAGEAASKVVNPIAWVLLIAQVTHGLEKIGPVLKYMGYAANAAAAAQLFTAYQTVASETKSGQIDATQLGGFNNALSSSLDTSETSSFTAATDLSKSTGTSISDATQSPYYQSIMGTGTNGGQAALLNTDLAGTAFAASTKNDGYTCDNGKAVPSGQTVCDEEVLDRGNKTASDLSDSVTGIVNSVPLLSPILSVLNHIGGAINDVAGWVLGKGFDVACKSVDLATFRSCSKAKGFIANKASDFMGFIMHKLLSSPFDHLSGGRTFDMMAAGASVSFNSSCQENLGCAQVDDKTAAAIQSDYLQQQQADFDQQSLFARMFSTNTPYSMVSRLALSMPGNVATTGNQIASSIIRNPLSTFGEMIGSIFTTHQAFAALPGTVNPFGVPQAGYLPKDIPNNPEQFWNDHCISGPEGWWNQDKPVGHQLDVTKWLNAKGNVRQDPNTGQAVFVHPNRCMLILSSVQSAGGLADPTLLPQDSLTGTASNSGGSAFRIATFNVLGASHDTTDGAFRDRAAKTIRVINSNNVDIVGLQEFQVKQRAYIYPQIKGTYDIFPAMGSTNDHHSVENSIIWNRNKFEQVGEGKFQPNLLYFCDSLNAPYVRLRDRSTGQEFYVLNTHDPANSTNNACANEAPKRRYLNALEHVKLINQLEAEGTPILYTGDFNSKYGLNGSGNPAYQGKAQNLTYCIVAVNGPANDAYDVFKKRPVTCPNKTPPGSGAGIDHVYLSKELSVTNYLPIASHTNGSDHPTLIFDVAIPGSGNTDSVTAATYNVVHAASFPDVLCIKSQEPLVKSTEYPAGLRPACIDRRSSQQAQIITGINGGGRFDIIGLQEMSQPQQKSILSKLPGYQTFPTPVSKYHSIGIIWNGAKLKKFDSGTFHSINNVGEPYNIPWVGLQAGSKKYYVTSVHEPNNSHGGGPQVRARLANDVIRWAKTKQGSGATIMVMGDFNEPLNGGQVYCILTTGGILQNAKDMAENRDPQKACPNPNGGIDQIYISPGSDQATGWTHAPDTGIYHTASDHTPVSVTLALPGSSASGSATPGSGFVGNDGFGGGWCTDYVKYILSRHSSKYKGGSMGDGKDFARNLGRLGYAVNHTAAVHAVVSFPGPPYGFVGTRYAGHVGIVGQVNKDGSIVVEESNFTNSMRYGQHTVSASEAKKLTYAHTEAGWH